MTVQDLIEELNKYPKDAIVYGNLNDYFSPLNLSDSKHDQIKLVDCVSLTKEGLENYMFDDDLEEVFDELLEEFSLNKKGDTVVILDLGF